MVVGVMGAGGIVFGFVPGVLGVVRLSAPRHRAE